MVAMSQLAARCMGWADGEEGLEVFPIARRVAMPTISVSQCVASRPAEYVHSYFRPMKILVRLEY